MAIRAKPAPSRTSAEWNPNDLVDRTGRPPSFHFDWKEPGKEKGVKLPPQRRKKRRLVCSPNHEMRNLHKLFGMHLENAIERMGEDNNGKENFTLRKLPSATGCVRGSNHYKNCALHMDKQYDYITDFKDAYPSLDLHRLTILLVFIFKYETYGHIYTIRHFGRNELAHYAIETDPMFGQWESFVQMAFGGYRGRGLAIGGPLSPFLLNLYCEVFLDSRIRQYCEQKEDKRFRGGQLCTLVTWMIWFFLQTRILIS